MNRKERRAAAKTGQPPTSPAMPWAANPAQAAARAQFTEALRFYQARQLQQAHQICQQILAANPRDLDALHLTGVMALELGAPQVAINALGAAIAQNDKIPALHNAFGEALRALGRSVEAVGHYRKALALDGKFAPALGNLGNALLQQGKPEEAVAAYRRAIALAPRSEATHNNLGNALAKLGKLDEAIAAYERAIALNPSYVFAHNNLGDALRARQEPERAMACYRQALAVRPDYAVAHCNLGIVLMEQDRPQEAAASFRQAIAAAPDFAAAHNNLGSALGMLRETSHLAEALAAYDRALALQPNFAEALSNRADALRELGRHEDAARDLEKLLEIDPAYPFAAGRMLYAKLYRCDWQNYSSDVEKIIGDVIAGKQAIAPFMFLPLSDSPSAQLTCAQIFHAHENRISRPPAPAGERYAHDKIRIAYLSADFHNHATTHLMADLFGGHDKARFETNAISFGPDVKDETRLRLPSLFDRFIDVRSRSDHDIAVLLKELEIDIAVDLKGYTEGMRPRILAYRPASIQVNYLGYPGTMGTDYLDYILADPFIIPEDQQSSYIEKVVYLPDTYQPNSARHQTHGPTSTRAAAGLPPTGFVFCSFNNNFKITPAVFDVWMRLLCQVDGSVLWLLEDNDSAGRNLRREAARRNVDPERLIFAPRMKVGDHLARQRLADLMLDTFPYNAHTTATDALWAGLPIVTCCGSSFAARVAASLLNAVGLPELVTPTLDAYGALALKLARDRGALAAVKSKLASNRDSFPLFDADRFRRHIESAYETMWARHQRGEQPAGFAVLPIDRG
jgi:protein O-GlcNAc transferase